MKKEWYRLEVIVLGSQRNSLYKAMRRFTYYNICVSFYLNCCYEGLFTWDYPIHKDAIPRLKDLFKKYNVTDYEFSAWE